LEEYNHFSLTDICEEKILIYFNEWKEKFSNNSNYLFFIWFILHIAEWYFWIDDELKKNEDRLRFKMQKKALKLEPDNKLFRWSIEHSKWNKYKAKELKNEVLNDKKYTDFLNSYGFAWEYLKDVQMID
jgi:hypothetical protein